MWTCPRCGRCFANRNQPHACGPLDLDRHLAGRDPEVVAIFWRLLALRRRWVDGHVVLARRLDHPRFRRVEAFSPRNHLHQFRLERLEDVDEEVAAWLAEAYRVGEQRHLRP